MNFSDYGISVIGSGAQARALCPKCSAGRKKANDKCLSVNTIEGIWNCKHCGWKGTLKKLKHKVFEYKKQFLPDVIIKYFAKRGISEGILHQENIGSESSFNKLWIKFPYFHNSICVNIKYKTIAKDFRQGKGGKKCLYRLDKITMSTENILVITEGEIDTLSVLEAGFEATSIPEGAPPEDSKNFTSKFDFLNDSEDLFKKFKMIIIAGDNDGPGKALQKELGRRIGYEKCYIVKYPDKCKDANDVLVNHGAEKLKKILSNPIPFPIDGIINAISCVDSLLYDYDNGTEKGLSTGWRNVDDLYTIKTGEMTIVTGIPGSGKSNVIDALCVNLALRYKWRMGVFSPENHPVERHIKTILEKVITKSFYRSRFGARMSKDEIREGLEFISDHFKFIVPKDDLITVDVILNYARMLCFQYGIQGLIIDPWNEIEHDQKSGEREDQYISRQLTKTRRFARLNGLHIWVVAHPTKLHKNSKGDHDPPTMYDISGGAQWRNKADNGLCIYRDFKNGTVKFIVQKIRFKEVGQIGSTELKWNYCGTYSQGG